MSFTRRSHLTSMFAAGIWGKWAGIVWGAYGIFAAIRDEVLPPQNEEKYRLIALIPHLSLSWWMVGALTLLVAWIFEASYKARSADAASARLPYGPTMTLLQEKLLSLLVVYLKQFAVKKLVVAREGLILLATEPLQNTGIKLAQEVYGSDDSASQAALRELIESMPVEYLRLIPEMRWDGPFVIAVPESGLRYLREHNL